MELLTPVRHPKVAEAERLETEISELAGRLAAATCRFLLLVAEFDRLDGWVGHRSCAQWLSWRCGLSASAAREHVRVAHALEGCPVIREAFEAGRLSYSKVRAITRVAHPGNETELVRTALVTTAAQLDRIVQAMGTATRQQVRDRHRRRNLSWRWDEDGMLVLTVRLDPDEGAVTLAALRAAQSRDPRPADEDAPSDGPPVTRATRASAGMAPAREAADPSEARSVTTADARAATRSATGAAGASAGAGERPGDSGRPDITVVDAFAAIMASCLASTTRDATDPDVFQVVILTDAIAPNATHPVGDAARRDSTPAKTSQSEGVAGHTGTRAVSGSRADADQEERPDDGSGAPGGVTDTGVPLPRDAVLRIACTAAIVCAAVNANGTPMDVGRKTRKVNAPLRRALRIRDVGCCRFPGCSVRRRLHAHHVRHWAHGGETTLANLISLCPAHHWAVHEGGHRVRIDTYGRPAFSRPDGRPLEPAPPMGPVTGELDILNEQITPPTIVPGWDGTPLDLDNAVLTLLQPAYQKTDPADPRAA